MSLSQFYPTNEKMDLFSKCHFHMQIQVLAPLEPLFEAASSCFGNAENYICCGEARFGSSSVFVAVSDDPHIIKSFLSLAELHFVILFYLMYVLAW